jgi:hypothetical protein
MKPVVALSLFALLFISCEQKKPVVESAAETPKALENSGPVLSEMKKYRSDLVEELYDELTDKRPELKKLEEDLKKTRSQTREINEDFNNYDQKSRAYFNSAEGHVKLIKDSLLKNEIVSLISIAKKNYENRIAPHKSTLKHVDMNNISLSDYHAAVKIYLTLPLIADYQKNHLPKEEDASQLVKEQERISSDMKGFVPSVK